MHVFGGMGRSGENGDGGTARRDERTGIADTCNRAGIVALCSINLCAECRICVRVSSKTGFDIVDS